MPGSKCIVCGSAQLLPVVDIADVPIHCNLLYPTETAAREAPRGDIRLSYCRACGHVFNRSFDPGLTAYGHDYEASLHASPRFRRYAEALAARLIERHGLTEKKVIEIGCGRGEFLELLCAMGNNRGIGFDKSYTPAGDGGCTDSRVTFVPEFFDQEHAQQADLVCCRHVLEHIERPRQFLDTVRMAIGDERRTAVYFEVPNALYTLENMGIWDLIYEHCSYFCAPSLAHLFALSGFDVTETWTGFEDQFLCLEALPAASPASDPPAVETLRDTEALAQAFPGRYRQTIDRWRSRLTELAARDRPVALWGAGSKGVTFLNVFKAIHEIPCVVDLNPRKHGKHVPGVGQPIMAPEELRKHNPSAVIVMNPNYRIEVQEQVETLGLSAEVISV